MLCWNFSTLFVLKGWLLNAFIFVYISVLGLMVRRLLDYLQPLLTLGQFILWFKHSSQLCHSLSPFLLWRYLWVHMLIVIIWFIKKPCEHTYCTVHKCKIYSNSLVRLLFLKCKRKILWKHVCKTLTLSISYSVSCVLWLISSEQWTCNFYEGLYSFFYCYFLTMM